MIAWWSCLILALTGLALALLSTRVKGFVWAKLVIAGLLVAASLAVLPGATSELLARREAADEGSTYKARVLRLSEDPVHRWDTIEYEVSTDDCDFVRREQYRDGRELVVRSQGEDSSDWVVVSVPPNFCAWAFADVTNVFYMRGLTMEIVSSVIAIVAAMLLAFQALRRTPHSPQVD